MSLLPLFEDLENGVVDAMRFQVDFMSCLCGVNGFEENFTFHKLNILWLHYYFALPATINYFFLLLCSDMVFNSSSLFMSISNLIVVGGHVIACNFPLQRVSILKNEMPCPRKCFFFVKCSPFLFSHILGIPTGYHGFK